MDAALARIKAITTVPEVGEVYHGKVVSILEFGAFVEILPGKEGLLHISELDYKKVDKVEDVLQVGDEVDVKLLEIDEKTGKMRLSRRALLPAPEGWVEHERKPRLNGGKMAAMAAAAEAVTATEEIAEEVPAVTATKAPAANPEFTPAAPRSRT